MLPFLLLRIFLLASRWRVWHDNESTFALLCTSFHNENNETTKMHSVHFISFWCYVWSDANWMAWWYDCIGLIWLWYHTYQTMRTQIQINTHTHPSALAPAPARSSSSRECTKCISNYSYTFSYFCSVTVDIDFEATSRRLYVYCNEITHHVSKCMW